MSLTVTKVNSIFRGQKEVHVVRIGLSITFKVKRGQPYFQGLVSDPKGPYIQNFKKIRPELLKLLTNLDKVQQCFGHFDPFLSIKRRFTRKRLLQSKNFISQTPSKI